MTLNSPLARFAQGAFLGALVSHVVSCVDSAQAYVSIPARARGTEARTMNAAGGALKLTRAKVSIGPLYLCATLSAEADLCSTAVAELLTTRSVDALDTTSQRLGTLRAVTETIRSGFFDYGISWQLTEQAPAPNAGASGGHSAELEGELVADDGTTLKFSADIDIEPLSAGSSAVTGLRTTRAITTDTSSLELVLDPSRWLARIDAAALLDADQDGDGVVRVEAGSQAYDAIVLGMTADAPPVLRWE